MSTNLLEKRYHSLEQRKNRLKELESSLNIQARKKRTRQLIELGGLVSKAQLDHWQPKALLGGLLFLKEKESDAKQIESWINKGEALFSASSKGATPKSPVIVTFASKTDEDLRMQLKSLGLKWNAIRSEWEGYVDVTALTERLRNRDASIREIGQTGDEQ